MCVPPIPSFVISDIIKYHIQHLCIVYFIFESFWFIFRLLKNYHLIIFKKKYKLTAVQIEDWRPSSVAILCSKVAAHAKHSPPRAIAPKIPKDNASYKFIMNN